MRKRGRKRERKRSLRGSEWGSEWRGNATVIDYGEGFESGATHARQTGHFQRLRKNRVEETSDANAWKTRT